MKTKMKINWPRVAVQLVILFGIVGINNILFDNFLLLAGLNFAAGWSVAHFADKLGYNAFEVNDEI